MQNFQTKYAVRCDLETTEKRAKESGFFVSYGGGRKSKGGIPANAQLIIELKSFDAKVLVSCSVVQVYWPGEYGKIEEIEAILKRLLVPIQSSDLNLLRSSVPTLRELQERQKLILEILKLEEEFERKTKLKEAICSTETVIALFEDQERVLGFDNKKRVQELKELVAQARGELKGDV